MNELTREFHALSQYIYVPDRGKHLLHANRAPPSSIAQTKEIFHINQRESCEGHPTGNFVADIVL